MRGLAALVLVISLTSLAQAQTAKPGSGGAYEAFERSVLTCLAGTQGDRQAQMGCLAESVEECMSKAGFYEACLHAVHGALSEARERVEAEAREPCFGGLDPACTLFVIGQGLIASGSMLDAQAWGRAVRGEAP